MHSEAGIDYLTMTSKPNGGDYGEFIHIGRKLQKQSQNEGNTLRNAAILGYEGTICGTVFVGESEQGAMVRVSGGMANQAAKWLKGLDCKTTRIDFQVTVWYDTEPTGIIRKYAEVAKADAIVADERTKRIIKTVEDNNDGYTLYIGSRTSDYYGRLYDKHAESHNDAYRNALRFEVEIKGKRANQAMAALPTSKRRISPYVSSFVGEWFTARGVYVPFLYANGIMAIEPISRETNDTARRLHWLRTQVRGTVAQLRLVVDTNDILDALGFFDREGDESVPPFQPPAA